MEKAIGILQRREHTLDVTNCVHNGFNTDITGNLSMFSNVSGQVFTRFGWLYAIALADQVSCVFRLEFADGLICFAFFPPVLRLRWEVMAEEVAQLVADSLKAFKVAEGFVDAEEVGKRPLREVFAVLVVETDFATGFVFADIGRVTIGCFEVEVAANAEQRKVTKKCICERRSCQFL